MFNKKRKSLATAGLIDGATADNLKTFLRIRGMPHIDKYEDNYLQAGTDPANPWILMKNEEEATAQKFSFNQIIHPEETQNDVFTSTAGDLIDKVINGQHACVFTYGASGSGKTHTIMGGAGDEAGILPRAVASIYQRVSDRIDARANVQPAGCDRIEVIKPSQLEVDAKVKNDLLQSVKARGQVNHPTVEPNQGTSVPEGHYALFVSMVELYNERCYDLLGRQIGRQECKIRQDTSGFYTDGCRQIRANSLDEALRIIEAGRQNLTTAATRYNQDSSRSHLIFTLRVCRRLPNASATGLGKRSKWMVSSMAFCDLAGVERRKKMGAQLGSSRSAESKTINKSLLQLRMVIGELYEQQAKPGCVAVGFRNSNLTRLMQCYLVGEASTRIVIAISNDPAYREETYQSMVFASKASTISMGYDKMGRKSRSKTNVSVIKEDDEEESEDEVKIKPSKTAQQQQSDGNRMPNYHKFTRDAMIADLEYYFEENQRQYVTMLTLKNGWKKEELEARKLRKFFLDQKKDLEIDLYNARAEKFNEIEIMYCKHRNETKELRRQIKELKKGNDVNDQHGETMVFLEDELKSQKLQTLALEQQVNSLTHKISGFESDLAVKTSELLAKTDAHEHDLARLNALENEKATLGNNLLALQDAYAGLQEEMARKEDETNDVMTIDEDDLLKTINPSGMVDQTLAMFADSDDNLPRMNNDEQTRQLQAQIDEMQSELDRLSEELEQRDSTIKNGRKSYANMEARLNEQNEEVSLLRHLIATKEDQISNVKNDLAELERDVQTKNKAIRNLQDSNDQKIKETETLRSAIAANQQELGHLKIALADQKILGQTEQEDQMRGIELMQTQKAELEATLKVKEAEIVEYVAEIAELKENATVQNNFVKQQKERLAQMEDREKKLSERNRQLEKDFEDSEDANEALKADFDDLKEQFEDKHNGTVNRELEERCFALTGEIDELCKKHHHTQVELETTKKELDKATEQLLNQKEEHHAEVNELEEKFAEMNVGKGQASDEYKTMYETLEKKFAKQEKELDDIKGKYDRSILRKQKERAIKQLDDERAKVQKLELMLTARENEFGQLQSLVHSNHSDALDHVLVRSTSVVKEEPQDLADLPPPPPQQTVQVKDEPVDPFENQENQLPRPNVIEQPQPIKKTVRGKKAKKLAPLSPDALNSPAEPSRTLRATRARTARK